MTGARIHSTAIVESGAILGENVAIGPFCHVEAGARLGNDVSLLSHVVVASGTSLGDGCKVFHHAVLGGDPQNNKHQGGPTTLEVGRNCVIREGVTMHRGSDTSRGRTTVGDDCTFLAYAHVAHDSEVGHHVTFSNNVMIGGHVVVGDYAILGGGAAVHQFGRVGPRAFVGGLAALTRDLIPYGMAVGNHAYLGGLNVVGMKRAGLSRHDIQALRHACRMLFDRTKPMSERAVDVEAAFSGSLAVANVLAFIRSETHRSFCTPRILAGSDPFGGGDAD
jgi:UDP-N-acetylglucosamine acyltransferase